MILCVDTSSSRCLVALVKSGEVLESVTSEAGREHSRWLLPMIEAALGRQHVSTSDLEAVGCGIGPGSFTGLRVGLTTAKMLAYQLEVPVVPLTSLEVLAWAQGQDARRVCAMLDARHQRVYAALYSLPAGDQPPRQLIQPQAILVEDLAQELAGFQQQEPLVLAGSGAGAYDPVWRESLPQAKIRPAKLSAQAMAELCWCHWQAGRTVMAAGVEPLYLRRTSAERMLMEGETDG